jgi:hypothetical protein
MMNAGSGLWLADGSTFSKNDFISRGSLNTINGILKFLQEMHVTVAYQQQEMLDETHLKISTVLLMWQYTSLLL